MVGGLVQKEDVGVLQDETAQIHAGLFPAGQAVEGLSPHFRGNGQAARHLVHGGVRIIAPDTLEFGGQLAVAAQSLRGAVPRLHGGGQLLHLLRQLLMPGKGGMEDVLHGIALRIDRDLGDQADTAVFGDHHAALVGLQLAGEDLKKGGFTCAVAAQEAHALTGFHLEGDAVQNIISYFEGFFYVAYTDFYHCRYLFSLPRSPQHGKSFQSGSPGPARPSGCHTLPVRTGSLSKSPPSGQTGQKSGRLSAGERPRGQRGPEDRV